MVTRTKTSNFFIGSTRRSLLCSLISKSKRLRKVHLALKY